MRRLTVFALVISCILTLTACGGEEVPAPPQSSGEEDLTLLACGELNVALPKEHMELLYIETDFPDAAESWKPLISVYEKASYETAQAEYGGGGGFLFGLLSMDQAAFEQSMSADGSGIDIFATDGERYYAYTYPTDVQFCRPGGVIDIESEDWKTWETLNEIGPQVREDFLARNGLQTFTVQDLASQPFVLDEAHVCLRYYSYFLKDGDTRLYDHLLLSQPAKQGAGGVWAVERWLDHFGNQYLYFPDTGRPAAEHYAQLQAECDAGEHPELLTPSGAAAAFVLDYFGHETAEGSFEKVSMIDEDYMENNLRLQQLALDVMAGRTASPAELLDCAGSASADNWGVLGRMLYGSDWFGPMIDALSAAAVGENQQFRSKAVMSIYLATREAGTDFQTPLSAILRAQQEAAPEVFLAALAEFPDSDQAVLEDAAGISTRLAASRTE